VDVDALIALLVHHFPRPTRHWDLVRMGLLGACVGATALAWLGSRQARFRWGVAASVLVSAAAALWRPQPETPSSAALLLAAAAGLVAIWAFGARGAGRWESKRWSRFAFGAASAMALALPAGVAAFHAIWADNATARAQVFEEMRRRPGDDWPAPGGHVPLGPWNAPWDQRGWLEPGGAFSPAFGSFGISWRLVPAAGAGAGSAVDALKPSAAATHRYAVTADGQPAIDVRAPHLSLRWAVSPEGGFVADVETRPPPGLQVEMLLRSVGPAGGPLRSISSADRSLLLSPAWRIAGLPSGAQVLLGDEASARGLNAAVVSSSVHSPGGWAFARVVMPAGRSRLHVSHEAAAQSPVPPSWPVAQGCEIQGLPEPFTNLVRANTRSLLAGIVDGESRPGDHINYPDEWLRDGAYIVTALARCGHRDVAAAMLRRYARQDFFGGFGAEADAPGLALWALHEVWGADPVALERVWPDVQRKAAILVGLLQARADARYRFDGPALAAYKAHPEINLVANPAKNGLIDGRMDWHRPKFYVNAVSFLGLERAARMASSLGHVAQADGWRSQAEALRLAWKADIKASRAHAAQDVQNPRTLASAWYPSGVAGPGDIDLELERWWSQGAWKKGSAAIEPQWTYFDLASAHQWLYLGQPARTREVLDWFAAADRVPGLWSLWEGRHEENASGWWERARGNVRPKGITPHYWSSAEALLAGLDMLALEAPGPVPTLLVGAGLPAAWLEQAVDVACIGTGTRTVSWRWNGKDRVEVQGAAGMQLKLGDGFRKEAVAVHQAGAPACKPER
jgi:hypothetical protein